MAFRIKVHGGEETGILKQVVHPFSYVPSINSKLA